MLDFLFAGGIMVGGLIILWAFIRTMKELIKEEKGK